MVTAIATGLKVSCPVKTLREALSLAYQVTARTTTLPVLSWAEIETRDGTAYLRANDLYQEITIDLQATVTEPGRCLIPIRKLAQFVRYAKETVVITYGKRISFSNPSGNISMSVAPCKDDLPKPLEIVGGTYELSEDFIQRMRYAIPYSAEDDTRPVLNVVLLDSKDGKVNLIAVDGFRLIVCEVKSTLPDVQLVIPRDICTLLTRAMKGKIKIKWDKERERVQFEDNGIRLVSQLTQGTFPPYQSLYPTKPPIWTFTCSGPVLEQVMRLMTASSTVARFTPGLEGVLSVALNDADEEMELSARIPATMTGDGKWAANQENIAEVARIFAEVTFEITGEAAPGKIHGDLPGVMVLVMPMFFQW